VPDDGPMSRCGWGRRAYGSGTVRVWP
jgi:hypothetical protein